MRRLLATVLALAALAAGCGDDPEPRSEPRPTSDPWRDIDTTMPSEDPVGTVYGYVQAMAAGDDDAACAFQYRGSSDFNADPCVLAEELPRRDLGFTAADWDAFAAYTLEDYLPAERHGWTVSLPTEPATMWRIRQDDAGIWHVL
jgi:hypothetical protein